MITRYGHYTQYKDIQYESAKYTSWLFATTLEIPVDIRIIQQRVTFK